MDTKTLYFVLADIFVPFFLNVSSNLQRNYGYKPYLVSFIPRDHKLLSINAIDVYPKSLSEIDIPSTTNPAFSDDEIKEMCNFIQLKLGGDFSVWKNRFSQVASYLSQLIDQEGIELIVLWNGQDYVGRILSALAIRKKIRCIYLENGYFSSTLQADPQGVNLAASVADYSFDKIESIVKAPASDGLTLPPVKLADVMPLSKWQATQLFIRRKLNPSFYTQYPELRGSSWFKDKKLQRKRAEIAFDQVTLPENFAFIPLQVHDDTQILLNSPLFSNPKDFIVHCHESIRSTLGETYPIVIKEHPEDIYRYDYADIQKKYPDIIWLRKFNIDEVIEKCSFMMVINSSVGLQAIEKNKRVLVFGKSIYSFDEICLHVRALTETPEKIRQALSNDDMQLKQNIQTYITFIRQHFFFKGSWKNQSPEGISTTIQRIHQLAQAT